MTSSRVKNKKYARDVVDMASSVIFYSTEAQKMESICFILYYNIRNKNLQCDWLLSVHYNTTMHAVFFSPVSWEWDTNVTTFSVVFVYKLLYNAGKNSVKIKKKKNRLKTKEKQAKQNDKI